ncbi:MAG: ferrous iron transport protein B [Pseudomonadota bacterium]|nr:ferrous iron transport protein B [Pseudomonadota bacterium]
MTHSDSARAPKAESPAAGNVIRPVRSVALVGNPNTGKSTLFNTLTGLRQKTGNYPGVTVEKHTGTLTLPSGDVQLVDVPGTYSLAAQSPDEMVAIDTLLGRFDDLNRPEAVLLLVDASNLRRNLYLASQVLEMGLPVVVALNMTDVAERKGVRVDGPSLAGALDARVVPMIAARGEGIDDLKRVLEETLDHGHSPSIRLLPELKQAAESLGEELRGRNLAIDDHEVERALIDTGGYAEKRLQKIAVEDMSARLDDLRREIGEGQALSGLEARSRYTWINGVVDGVETRQETRGNWSDHIDRFVSHPGWGSLLFILVMAAVFQAVFSWATPMMEMIDTGAAWLGATLSGYLPPGALSSLLTDGMIAGVGSVVIFLPQILILFAFIILLEDTGYMARAAFLMDRLMRWCGLSGQSFIPMLSSFACAVPGIMATRVIPNRRDRIATILAAPFMTCSARLPVYALLIAAFVPQQSWLGGWVNLQGLVLLGLYLLGILGGVLTAFVLKKTLLRGPTPTFLMELPPYRRPNLKSVLLRLMDRALTFLRRAGTVIFTVALIVWALAYFPRPAAVHDAYTTQRAEASNQLSGVDLNDRLLDLDNQEAAAYLEQSFLGRMGRTVEPVFRPLGWDWKVSAAVIAGFPAREVVIAVLGTIYAVGQDVDEQSDSLKERLQAAQWPNGDPVYTLPMVLGLLVFYAFCLQCVATVATIRREADSWPWALFAWTYMTALGYLAALFVFQIGSRI